MIIYKITNLINKKIYIGQTIVNINKRFLKHCTQTTGYLSRAISKYGRSNFSIEEIDRANTYDELNDKEIYWISFYNSTNPKIGYNIQSGGQKFFYTEEYRQELKQKCKSRDYSKVNFSYTKTDEFRKIKSNMLKELWKDSGFIQKRKEGIKRSIGKKRLISEEQRLKLAESCRNRFKGIKLTEEQKELRRKNRLGKKLSEETKEKISQTKKRLKDARKK